MADREEFATAVGVLIKGVRDKVARPAEVTVGDINNLTVPGWHQATQAGNVSIPNTPAPGDRMTYEVISDGDPAIVTQVARSQVTPRSWWRVRQVSGAWSAWYGGYDAMQTLGTTDMNTLTLTGTYLLVNGAALAASTNLGTPNRQIIRVQTALLPYTTQETVDLTTGRTFTRAYNNGIWSAWNSTATLADIIEPDPTVVGIDSAGAGGTNALLVEDWSRRRGGRKRIATGAVALRFDHGLANFNTKIRPLLEARNLPYSLALNAGNWANAENTGVTKAMVNSWVQGGLCEIWNHSLTHNSTSSEATWRNEIVGGLNQLRADLPAAQIDGWAVPSLQGIGYVHPDGTYLMGSSVEEYYNTPAGRLILATHAVATGYIPATFQRILDGTPRQSQLHWTFDKSTLTQIQGFIGTAEAGKRGLQLMLHPSLVDTADHITTATVTQILDHIVAERDAGRLTVLGPYDLMLADTTGDDSDTGWNTLPATHASTIRTGGTIALRRTGHRIRARFTAVPLADGAGPGIVIHPNELPLGYTAPTAGTIETIGNELGNVALNYLRANGAWWWVKSEPTVSPTLDRARVSLSGEIEWFTDDPWPTTTP